MIALTTKEQVQTAMADYEAWYDALSEEKQELVDEIHDRTSFIIDEEEYDAFMQCLEDDYGLTTSEQFQDAFQGEWEGQGEHLLTQFAEQFCEDVYYSELESLPLAFRNAIDYEAVWYQSLQYDMFAMEFRGNTYFFWNQFWFSKVGILPHFGGVAFFRGSFFCAPIFTLIARMRYEFHS